jgi:PAS domain S-box-containing protein
LGTTTQHLKTVIDASPVAIAVVDLNYVVTYWNRAAEQISGFSAAEVVGLPAPPSLRGNPDEAAGRLARMAKGEVLHGLEDKRRRKDGKLIDTTTSVAAFFDAEGAVLGVITACQDITDRKRADQLSRIQYGVVRCLAEADGAGAALQSVMQVICEGEDWDLGRYFRLDEATGVLCLEEFWSRGDAESGQLVAASRSLSLRPGDGLVGTAWQSGEPLWCANASLDARVTKFVDAQAMTIHGLFTFPVRAAGQIIGMLVFTSREIRSPDDRLLQAVWAIGAQIGQYLRRSQTEKLLRDSEARFRSLIELSSDWCWEMDADLRYVELAEPVKSQWRSLGSSAIGLTRWELPGVNPTEKERALIDAAVEARLPYRDLGYEVINADGSRHYLLTSAEPIFDEAGRFTGYRGVGQDITERKRSDQMLQIEHIVARCLADAEDETTALQTVMRAICECEDWNVGRYYRLDEAAGVMRHVDYWAKEGAGIEAVIAATRHIAHRPEDGLVGAAWQSGEPIWTADAAADPRVIQFADPRPLNVHALVVFPIHSLGKVIGVLLFCSEEIRAPDERLLRTVRAIGGQIGQYLRRSQAEAVLRESEARFRSLTALSSDWYWELDANLRFVEMTDPVSLHWGVAASEMVGLTRWEVPGAHPSEEDRAAIDAAVAARLPYRDLGYDIIARDGSRRYVQSCAEPIFDDAGRFAGYRGVGRDITERKRIEEVERQVLGQLNAIVSSTSDAIISTTLDGIVTTWNKAAEHIFGYSYEEMIGQPISVLATPGQEDDLTLLMTQIRLGERAGHYEAQRRRKDGTVVDISVSVSPTIDRHGRVTGASEIARDVTEVKAAEEKQRRLSEQVQQLQKMQAIGQLTGGVAHDFNNLLGVISGNMELLDEALHERPDLQRMLQAAIRATARGATLTHSLLAFSRKQPLEPRSVDANDLIREMTELIRRTVPESIDIAFVASSSRRCDADPGQLQNALLNMVVNARDAMPSGGFLTIETADIDLDDEYAAAHAEVTPGEYVVLAISDTGTGMPPEVVARVFEPFFTTKGLANGTGLGLSMVYGFVKQSLGHVKIYSEVGHGTTVRLYLPHNGRSVDQATSADVTTEFLGRGGETILVVEDDDDLRELTCLLVRSLGYEVRVAEHAQAALDLLNATPRIKLLLTDVVLPGRMNGPHLAKEARRINPNLKVIYMSGYTENAIVHHGRLDPGVNLLQKPFRKRDLAAKVRAALDQETIK